MKRFQTIPSLLCALFVAGTFVVTGCNPGTISGPDYEADFSVQVETDTNTYGLNASLGDAGKGADHNTGNNAPVLGDAGQGADHNTGNNAPVLGDAGQGADHNTGNNAAALGDARKGADHNTGK